jgi:hypothetical protein
LAEASHLNIPLFKLRGENAPDIWFPHSLDDQVSIQLHREGMIQRQTKETRISVHLLLNGESTDTHIDCEIGNEGTKYPVNVESK